MRKIIIVDTRKAEDNIESFELEDSELTWGELKGKVQITDLSNSEATLRKSGLNLVHDLAEIPSGDQRIYLTQKDMKSGSLDDLSYRELRVLAKEKGVSAGLGGNPTTKQLKDALKPVYKTESKTKKAKEVVKEAISKDVKTLKSDGNSKVEAMKKLLSDTYLNLKNYFETEGKESTVLPEKPLSKKDILKDADDFLVKIGKK